MEWSTESIEKVICFVQERPFLCDVSSAELAWTCTKIWCKKLVQVSCASFVRKFLYRVSPPLVRKILRLFCKLCGWILCDVCLWQINTQTLDNFLLQMETGYNKYSTVMLCYYLFMIINIIIMIIMTSTATRITIWSMPLTSRRRHIMSSREADSVCVSTYTLPTNGSYRVPYRTQRFHV